MESAGDETKTQALLQHAVWLRRLAGALVRDSATADDLMQETWVAALATGVDSSKPLQPWLRRVATNFARKSYRKRERFSQEPSESLGPLEQPADESLVDPALLTERLENESLLTESLSELAEPFRSTLYLRYYEGLAPKDIAQRTSTPPGTVRWRLKRGLELMRERLDESVQGGRDSWMVLLAPIAGSPTGTTLALSGATTASSTSALFLGVLAMSTLLKILIAVTASVALYVGLDQAGQLPLAISLAGGDGVPIEIDFHPIETADLQVASAPRDTNLDAVSQPQRSGRTPLASSPEEPLVAATLQVLALVTDEKGVPLQGVRAFSRAHNAEAFSDEAGRVSLSVDRDTVFQDQVILGFSLAKRVTATRSAKVTRKPELDLGEIRMDPGGSVAGRIVNQSGAGIAGASITWMEGTTPARRLESLRFGNVPPSYPSTTTLADGSFSLQGVPTGRLRVWANAAGYEPQFTVPIEVRFGFESRGVEITLAKLQPENHLLVRVLDPSGAASPGAQLEYRYSSESSGMSQMGTRYADDEGRHEFVLLDDVQVWITATDSEKVYGSATRGALTTGPDEVRLQLTEARNGNLTVRRERGELAKEFTLELRSADGEFLHERIQSDPEQAGPTPFRLPSDTFLLRVIAPLAQVADLGPIDVADAEALSIRLRELPGMRGVVRASGEAIQGARITLHEAIGDDLEFSVNGYPCGHQRDSQDDTETDDSGKFVLTVRKPGRYVIRAEAEGYAPADTTPFHVDTDLRGFEVNLELGRGGVLEGEVRTGTSESPLGTIVGISRGDTYAQTMQVDSDGKFRFEGLTPGPWRVSAREEPLRAGNLSTATHTGARVKPYSSLDWDCEVFEGRTTFYALNLDGTAEYEFRGHFALIGDTDLAWNARLVPTGQFFAADGLGSVDLDRSGDFTLPVHELGDYQLVLRADWAGASEYFLVDPIDVATDSPWSLEIPIGTLQLENVPEARSAQAPELVVLHLLPAGGFILIGFSGDEHGERTLERVPAGHSTIVRPELSIMDPKKWEVVREFDLPPGGSLPLSL